MAILNVNDKRTAINKGTTFDKLAVGDVFEDGCDVLCIKIDAIRCFYMRDDDTWDTAHCEEDEVVFPLRATLTIEGRE